MDYQLRDSLARGTLTLVFGLLIAILDYILHWLRNKSFLKLKYNRKFFHDGATIVLWAVGGGIVSGLLSTAQVLNLQNQTLPALFVAISWPLIITQFVEKVNKQAAQPQVPDSD
jgi:uncharacterized membrane protein